MKKPFYSTAYFWLPILLGVAMLPVPLLRDFHIESALVVAMAGCFWAAWRGGNAGSQIHDGRRISFILQTLYLVGLPLFINAVVSGCFSWHGLGFWILYPVPSVLLGYSLGRLFRLLPVAKGRFWVLGFLFIIAVGGLVAEFFTFPQVYFFNHVWGGWPGPVYDETVKVTGSLIFFRGLTLLWVGVAWLVPARSKSAYVKIGIACCLVLLAAGYSQLPQMGIITPADYLQEQLGGVKETAHFETYYDADSFSKAEIDFIARKQEFYFQQITEQLDITWPAKAPKIESYLYAHPWQKKALVGAKFTSYVPVWLEQDQLHIAKPQIPGSLKHELVHVLAKQFGNRLFNASWSIGLVEGLAVAVAPDESPTTTIDQIVVSEKPYPTAQEIQHALSPTGFYGGRSAVNYTQSGSFVQYLLENYPVKNIKEAYHNGDVSGAFRERFSALVTGWHQKLDTVSVDFMDQRVAGRLYSFRSLFEKACPHVQSNFAHLWDQYEFYMAKDDTISALQYLDRIRSQYSNNLVMKSQWAFLNLKQGNTSKVQQHASMADSSANALLLNADAFALAGEMSVANDYVARAETYLQAHPDSLLLPALYMRQDSKQWQFYNDIVYKNAVVSDSVFKALHPRIQVRALEQSMQRENWGVMRRYAEAIRPAPANTLYIDTYLKLTEQLAFAGYGALAVDWLKKIEKLKLRPRYVERVQQAKEWVDFLN